MIVARIEMGNSAPACWKGNQIMRVRVLRAESTYTATFARPAYEFVGRWADLFTAIHNRLGARPEDVRFESTTTQPNDFNVTWMDFRLDVIARFRLASLEVWTRNPKLIKGEKPPFIGVLLNATAAARDIAQGLLFVSQ